MTKPETDAEALAALMPTYGQIPWQELIDAISEARGCKWEPSPDENYYIGHQPASGVNNMNSLNRIVSYFVAKDRAANRRAQPASELADDARKVAEALALIECVYRKNCVAEGEPSSVIDAMQAALSLAESLPGKIEKLETENIRLRGVIERDRTKTAEVISTAREVVASRAWLAEGRGSYAFDDETYQSEFGAAVTEMLAALDPLRALAADWSDCPKDFQGARVDWKARAEAAESQIAARDAEVARLWELLTTPSFIRETSVGPELFVFGAKVTSWFGTSNNERAYKLANDIDLSAQRAAIAPIPAELAFPPNDCTDKASCARHRMCMYLGNCSGRAPIPEKTPDEPTASQRAACLFAKTQAEASGHPQSEVNAIVRESLENMAAKDVTPSA